MSWKWAIPAICLTFLAVAASAGAEEKKTYAADKGPATVDVSGFPDDVQAAYKVFATKCSKCHTLARPINTDMTTGEWKRYVKRMANKPKSGISKDEAKDIFKFLKFYQAKKDAKK